MSAEKEKAPTRQRQGFGVNHYEAIHMSKDTTTQHTRNSASTSVKNREFAVRMLNRLVDDIAQGKAPHCGKRVMVSVLFEEAVAIYEKGVGNQHELAAVLLGAAAGLVVDMLTSGELPFGIADADSVTRH